MVGMLGTGFDSYLQEVLVHLTENRFKESDREFDSF
jgi:hypothetical protein